MDSGNSSSMQSSSCGGGNGDEEYDSRPDSVLPAFLNTFNPLSSSSSNQHPHQQPTFFDPSPNYHHHLNPFSQSQPLNFDALRPARSEPNCTDLDNLVLQQQGSSTMQSRLVHDHNDVRSTSTQSDQQHQHQHQHQPSGAKNPKKRTRASRRAPTTVMTTDTTNFRAMVQEFTGIPAPPFSGSSYSGRLELFGSGSSRSGYSESLGSSFYPLRPSAKRLHTTTPLLNNPLLDANAFNPSPSSNYQLPQNMSNQSQIPSFQSFLDPPPLHPSIGLPGFSAKSHGGSGSVTPSIDELGLSHGHGHGSVGLNDGNKNNNNQDHLRPLDGNYSSNNNDHSSQRVNGCKLNYSAFSSGFHNDKSLEIVSSRGEGTVDPWICPAD